MKQRAALLLSLALALGLARADEQKPAAKKSEKPKAAARSDKNADKNVFQKAESSVGEFAHKHKIWTRSEPRGTAQKKPAKKTD